MKNCILALLFLLPSLLSAQVAQENSAEIIERIVEEFASNADSDLDPTELAEQLQQLAENPMNINTASAEQLEQLLFLSDRQVQRIMWARRRYRSFLSPYELLYLEGFSQKTVQRLQPFVRFEARTYKRNITAKKIGKYGKHKLMLRQQRTIEQAVGYSDISPEELEERPNARYLGDRNKLYMRYEFSALKKVQAGITAEKDPGEQFLAGQQKQGFDYYSAYAQVNDIGKLKRLVIGDFQANFGQGLVASSGFSPSKSSYVLQIRKKEKRLTKYSSTDENRFLRGAGASFEFGKFAASVFASYKKRDASISEDTTEREQSFSSFNNTGFHRTHSEQDRRKTVQESVAGANIKYTYRSLSLGATALAYHFEQNIEAKTELRNTFREAQQLNSNYSLNYDWRVGHHRFFGEAAISQNGRLATLHGANLHLNKNVDFAALYRYYDKEYQAMFGQAFGEASTAQNENGVYFGVEIHPAPKWRIATYADSYYFPWPSFSSLAPLRGTDYLAEIEWQPTRNINSYIRFKTETKSKNLPATDNTPIVETAEQTKWSFRWHTKFYIHSRLSFNTRVEYSGYELNESPENGFLLYQDIDYRFENIPISLSSRFALFQTTYNTRVYAYEKDILYAFSIPAYNGNGFRTYLNLSYEITPNIKTWLKIGTTVRKSTENNGSGLEEVDGNSRSEIKAQVRFKF